MPPMPKKSPPGPKTGPNRNLLIALGAGLAIVAAIVIGVLVLGGGSGSIDAASADYLNGIPQSNTELGSQSAKLTMTQFEDLQCPICQRYTTTAQQDIVEQYVKTGQVKLRFAGLTFIGNGYDPNDSEKALRYALAAGKENKLWQFAELLYANQGAENSGWVTDSLLEKIAKALNLDWAQLQTESASAGVTQQINAMAAEAQARQVQGTPSFFVQVGKAAPYQVNLQDANGDFSVTAFAPIVQEATAK